VDVLSFIAAIVKALAWPLAAVILGLVFRRSLNQLLRTVRRLKAPGLEIERDIAELQEDAAQLSLPPSTAATTKTASGADLSWHSPAASDFREQVSAVADIAPSAAIALAWTTVERKLRAVVAKKVEGGESQQRRFSIAHISALRQAGVIDNAVENVLTQMRDVRNRVVHQDDSAASISSLEAKTYGEVAASLLDYLDSLLRYSG
jgi:hypothetical protein